MLALSACFAVWVSKRSPCWWYAAEVTQDQGAAFPGKTGSNLPKTNRIIVPHAAVGGQRTIYLASPTALTTVEAVVV